MALKDIEWPTKDIEVPGCGVNVTIRGLSVLDISNVYRNHRDPFNKLFARFFSGEMSVETVAADLNFADIVGAVLESAPRAAAELIAVACGEPKEIEQASRLPLVAQVTLLQEIVLMTFEQEGGAGNLLAVMTEMFQSMTAKVEDLKQPANGSKKLAA